MKTTLLIFLVAFGVRAQAQLSDLSGPGCGPNEISFKVNTAKNSNWRKQPDAGSALVYVIEDDTRFHTTPKPTVRLGVDGAWAGATHGNSYFSFSVTPGQYHLCASWQGSLLYFEKAGGLAAAAHLSAQAQEVYFFRIQNLYPQDGQHPPIMELEPLDSDEGQLLASRYSQSTFQQKP